MSYKEYVGMSLELHLFFDRIMKEHSFFIELSLTEKNKQEKNIANNFQKLFSDILGKIVTLANGRINNNLLNSGEIVTDKTLEAERKSSNLTQIQIDTNITLMESELKSGNLIINEELVNAISNINKQTLPIIKNLIYFKNDILNKVLSCNMYTTNYPLLITHIINEAKMYYNLLSKVENKESFSNNFIYEQELFWNNIMKEHAEFIRGLLDPSEKDLIITAGKYVTEYEIIMQKYKNNPSYLTGISLNETIDFRKFKIAGEEGILNCKVKSIIIPLLADHVLREANHFIRILNSVNSNIIKST